MCEFFKFYKEIFKNCALFTDCNTKINNSKDIDVLMARDNFIEYSDTYFKTTERL